MFTEYGLVARIQPHQDSIDPVPEDLLRKIREEVLPKDYRGVPVFVEYSPRYQAQN